MTGISTIRRGIGFGPLATITRGYLGGVALLLLRCIPCIHIVGLYPSLTLQSTTPALSMALMATLAGVEVVSLVPALSVDGCDC